MDETRTTDEGPIPLVADPGGAIRLRDARSRTERDVVLQPFAVGRTAVTRRQWALDDRTAADRTAADRGASHGDVPICPTSWFDAVEWCNRVSRRAGLRPAYSVDGRSVVWDPGADGYRLPTEAEWEHAARAGTSGPTYGPLGETAWTAEDRLDGPQPVAGRAPNALGAHDMLGNVWEWCWDYADPARYGDYRVLRGGGWADRAWSVRASVRRGSLPESTLEDVGFRVARGVVGEAGGREAQGWSARRDVERADVRGPVPFGWTPLREIVGQRS